MVSMTATAVDGEKTVSDVGTNMMGIRSKKLYNLLRRVVESGDISALSESKPEEVLAGIIQRITVNIPEDAFRITGSKDEIEQLKDRLMETGNHLRETFQAKSAYPFTILRICELCYDPLKYFRIFELEKFVNAITSCCLVETSWKSFEECPGQKTSCNHSTPMNSESDQEDVSLTKIPWISEEDAKGLVPFIKEIDSVMSVNFGFDDDEEDDEDENMGVDLNKFSGSNGGVNGDFVIEEYYEDELGGEDEDDDDDDDYVEGAQSEEEDPEEEESDEDEASDSKDTASLNQDDAIAQRKRKTMELDDFEYVEKSSRKNKLTTPKKTKPKSRDGLIESPECNGLPDDRDTPVSSQEEERPDGQSQTSSVDQEISFLISPRNSSSNNNREEGKIRGVTDAQYEMDLGSPLSNRAR